MSDTIKVGILGAAGYAGQNLVEILVKHPNVELVFATSNSNAGQFVDGTDLRYIRSEDVRFNSVDAVFLALPHKASAPIAKEALDAGKKVIDLSADLRFTDPEEYAKWYDIAHPHPELLPVPYGLPELHRDKIAEAQAVGVPGCYPTATLLGLYPLLSVEGLSVDAPIIVDAKSGISGAGRTPSDSTHFVEVYGDIIPYKAGRVHRHVGEMEQEIRNFMPSAPNLIFTPHLVPVDRGLMASLYLTLTYPYTSERLHSLYANVYLDEPLINVRPLGTHATLKRVQRANHCEISITPIDEYHVHITSTLDNLRKGAASQAVQCFNLMYGFSETASLL